jgi:myo-inositol-1(or 4)-monophosphatase
MSSLPKNILEVAVNAAIEAGKTTLKYFRSPSLIISAKEDSSPVTAADKESEEIIRRNVKKHFPAHGIIGEEYGETIGADPVKWIIDPLDGTKTFVRGVPFYGVLIGIEVDGEIEAGVVHMPALNETYYARKGNGSFLNNQRIEVSKVADLEGATFLITSSSDALLDNEKRTGYLAIQKRAQRQRGMGDCYGHMLVASGRAEIMLDARMHPWDCAALKIIVEEAGGMFTDWNGNKTIYGESAVSVNAALSSKVQNLLRSSVVAAL